MCSLKQFPPQYCLDLKGIRPSGPDVPRHDGSKAVKSPVSNHKRTRKVVSSRSNGTDANTSIQPYRCITVWGTHYLCRSRLSRIESEPQLAIRSKRAGVVRRNQCGCTQRQRPLMCRYHISFCYSTISVDHSPCSSRVAFRSSIPASLIRVCTREISYGTRRRSTEWSTIFTIA